VTVLVPIPVGRRRERVVLVVVGSVRGLGGPLPAMSVITQTNKATMRRATKETPTRLRL